MWPSPSVFKTPAGFKQAVLHHRCCAANENDGNVTSRRCHLLRRYRRRIPRQKFQENIKTATRT